MWEGGPLQHISSCKNKNEKYFIFTRGNIHNNSSVGQLGAVGRRPCYETAGQILSKKTHDRPAGPIIAASGKQGCTL